jgi:GNAT superfamily N-acetyltransferase
VTLIVLTGEPQRIVATGEYVRLKGQDTAEVAFLVDDAYQGKGLGTLLLERLALIAAKRGVRRFQAFTLAQNQKMLNGLHGKRLPGQGPPGGGRGGGGV